MCNCRDVEIGSYDNQIWVHAPAHMPKDNGYCLDRCVAEEVMQLWMKGITTTGCCCGHNKVNGFIGVIESDISKMKEMGYQVVDNPSRPGDEDSFYPKSQDAMICFPNGREMVLHIIGERDLSGVVSRAMLKAIQGAQLIIDPKPELVQSLYPNSQFRTQEVLNPTPVEILQEINASMPAIAAPKFPENLNTRKAKRKRYLKD